jgi:murein DD-endopeptidase MepM/ murein hydrolase activator NlpD
MDKHYTFMIIPEKHKRVKTFTVPSIMVRLISFFIVLSIFLAFILVYDYFKITSKVFENKHLKIENQLLREKINLFNMRINTLSKKIKSIGVFEKKLRIITGLEKVDFNKEQENNLNKVKQINDKNLSPDFDLIDKNQYEINNDSVQNIQRYKKINTNTFYLNQQSSNDKLILNSKNYKKLSSNKTFKVRKSEYDQKIADTFGLQASYSYTKEWSDLIRQSFVLANEFTFFDVKYSILQKLVKDLEIKIDNLDQFLLDKDSFIRSTPTILPTKGWITSYYGPRHSPYSNKIKMHEGIDIGAPIGTHIFAPADGFVNYAGNKPGYGKFVQIDHGYGIRTIFGHAHSILVQTGDKIKRGQSIAKVGNSGLSTGPHLHYEVRVSGVPVDPLYFIFN